MCSAATSTGYYRDEAATAESFRDGWFHTGDLGRIDKRGFLYFQGRVKNLIVLSNGENVSPEELETRLYQLDGVRDAIVYEKISRSRPRSTPIQPCSRTRRRSGAPSARSTGTCRLISRLATSFTGKTNLKKPRRRKSSAGQLRRQHHERENSGDPCRDRRRAGIGPA